jgi:23S rRNA pseudouridine1911/1915/1917 synthase
MERRWQVSAEDAGERLDRWLCRRLPALSRKRVKELLDAGRVRVRGRRVVIASWELGAGDEVWVEEAPARESLRRDAKGGRHGPREAPPPARERKLIVYHEDRDLIVVEKPAGLLAVPQPGAPGGENLVELVRRHLRRRYPGSRGSFLAPLHRLDAETSGVMALALSRVGERLELQFKDHSLRRTYVAVVWGAMGREQGIIDRPIAKGNFGAGQKVRTAARGEGRRAVTEYRVKERYPDATLVEICVRTGRTHQIRAHLASEGFPVIGDAVYGRGAGGAKGFGFRRHALHACELGFHHPATGKPLSFRSPIPRDMRELIDLLRSGGAGSVTPRRQKPIDR